MLYKHSYHKWKEVHDEAKLQPAVGAAIKQLQWAGTTSP